MKLSLFLRMFVLITFLGSSTDLLAWTTTTYTPKSLTGSKYRSVNNNTQEPLVREQNITYQGWSITEAPQIVFVPGIIPTPIRINSGFLMEHPEQGQVEIDITSPTTVQARSVTRVPAAKLSLDPEFVFQNRPTLYVTIPGQQEGEFFNAGTGAREWQQRVDQRLLTLYGGSDYGRDEQFHHFMVDWPSTKNSRKSVDDVKNVIQTFLNQKQHAWDVVIIGHSRGGIFAHNLANKLNSSRINNMFVHLLDPTASIPASDFFPSYIADPKGDRSTQCFNYYDGLGFATDLDASFWEESGAQLLAGGTVADKPIQGCINREINQFSHMDFVDTDNILSRGTVDDYGLDSIVELLDVEKDQTGFEVDGAYNSDLHSVSAGSEWLVVRNREIDIDSQLMLRDGNIVGFVAFTLGSVALDAHFSVGEDGLDAGYGLAFASARVVVNEDVIEVTRADLVQQYSSGYWDGTFHTSVKYLGQVGAGAEFNASWRLNIEYDIFNVKGDLTIFDGSAFQSIGKEVGRGVESVVQEAGRFFSKLF